MSNFKVVGEGVLAGTITRNIHEGSINIETSIDTALKNVLSTTGYYTSLQLGTGLYQEQVTVTRTDTGLSFTRPSTKFTHNKGTSIKFTCNVHVVAEMLA